MTEPENDCAVPGEIRPKRETKSYMTLYTGLQSRVDTALSLMQFVKVEKGSQEMMAAVQGLLRGPV